MGVRAREVPDLGGRQVDVYDRPEYLSAIVFQPEPQITADDVTASVLGVMRRLRSSPKKQRDRDFTAWFGTMDPRLLERWAAGGLTAPRWAIGLPETFNADVHMAFQRGVYDDLGDIIDIGRSTLVDIAARPLARYAFGDIALYVDGTAPASERDDGVELRSAEVTRPVAAPAVKAAAKAKVTRRALPAVESVSPALHALEDWEERRAVVVDMVDRMTDAASYASLKTRVQRSFGIEVVEEASPDFVRLGSLTAGWVDDGGIPLRITIRKQLAPELKYVSLAHELAHYVRHFPLIYCGQLVEQIAWHVPELEAVYQRLLTDHLGDVMDRLEYDANVFASYLLIPPMYDLDKMASLMFESDRGLTGPDLAWRFLQPLFPVRNASGRSSSWAELDDVRAATAADMAFTAPWDPAGDELYDAIVRATATREDDAAQETQDRIDEGLVGLARSILTEITGILDEGVDRERLRSLAGEDAGVSPELTPHRELVPPLRPDPSARPRRVPLVPARALGRQSPTWVAFIDEHGDGARSVEEWGEAHPDATLALYPLATHL